MKETLVVAHDAGGAEIVSSWVNKNSHEKFYFYVAGPAIKIFENKISFFINLSAQQVDEIFPRVEKILMGTSWKSDFERNTLKRAKVLEKRSIAFLDHWVNYTARFILNSELLLPDEIWASDLYAFNLAASYFPSEIIKLIENPYFEEVIQKASAHTRKNNVSENQINVLYVCEPISVSYGYDEYFALKNYLNYLADDVAKYHVKIRLHPSESKGKYEHIINKFRNKINVVVSAEQEVYLDCLWAEWVAGCETIAMVIALKLGKKVFSVIPKEGKPCALPFPEIIRLFQSTINK